MFNTRGKSEKQSKRSLSLVWRAAILIIIAAAAGSYSKTGLTSERYPTARAAGSTGGPVQFCNTTPIAILGTSLGSGPASPYPSRITVSGLTGVVADVSITLTGVQHDFGRDIDVLLVSPDGRKFIPMSDVGQANGLDNPVTLTLSDAGTALITSQLGQIASGTYKPTNHNDALALDSFAAPAPGPPYNSPLNTGSSTFASVFNGADPNGTWSLYVMDDDSSNRGNIAGGWCLDIATSAPQAGEFRFDLSAYEANAGSTATLTVGRVNGMAGPASVDYTTEGGTATGGTSCGAGIDYIAATGTLDFADGETSKTISVELCPDAAAENRETVDVRLSDPTNGAALGTPSTLALSINPQAAPVMEFCDPRPIEIAASGGTAGPANPYPSGIEVSGMSGLVTNVSVTLNEFQHDVSEEVDILLVSPTGQKFILVSDAAGGFGFDTPTTITLTDSALTTLPATSLPVTPGSYKPTNVGTGDGFPQPAPGAPYEQPAPAGAATLASVFNGFDPNGTWNLYVYDDFVGFTGAIQGGWCLRIATDSPQSPGQLQFGTGSYSGNEGETASVMVTRTGGLQGEVTVDYATSSGTATGGPACGTGVDYINSAGTVTFPEGELSKVVPVQLCLDAPNDVDETFNIALSNPTGGATVGAPGSATVRIMNVEETSLQFFASRYYAREGMKQTVVLTRMFNQIGTASVNYSTSSGTAIGGSACTDAVDFINTSGTITFQPNAHVQSFDITTCSDTVLEEIETLNISLSDPVGARLESPSASQLSIYESTWQKQTTTPTGQTIEDVHMVSASEGWAVGGFGLILHTVDGGVTWESQTSGTYEALRSVFFLDSRRGWAAGNIELYTTDGGQTWEQGAHALPGVGTIYQLSFADVDRGSGVGNNAHAMMRTTDGGRTWFRQILPIEVNRVKYFDAVSGIASGAEGVLVTNNGGDTWTLRSGATGADEWFDLEHGWRINNSTIIGGLIRQKLEYTTDGGVTWTGGVTPDGTFVFQLFFADAQNGWGVGTKENIVHTSDGGRTWITQRGGLNSAQEFNAPLEDIHMFDPDHGIAMGNTGLTYTTSDGGSTWTSRQSGSGYLVHKLVARDSGHAWAAMENGEILKTVNGGASWSRKKVYVGASPADSTIAGIAFPNDRDGWACIRGRIGTPGIPSVLRTVDSGDTWQDVNNSPAHNCWALDTFDGQTIVSVGFEGGGAPIVRSTDGGQSWTYTVFPNSSIIRDVDMVTSNIGYSAAGAQILKSTDGFATWSFVQVGGNWIDVSFVDENNGWALGASPTNALIELWRTTNGGESWTATPMPDAVAVHAIDPQTAWVVEHDGDPNPLGNATFALRTTNGGQTFERELVSLENVSTSLYFVDRDNGWVGGINKEAISLTSNGADIFRRGSATPGPTRKTRFDFDGDGKADIAVYRSGTWYVDRSTMGFTGADFGLPADKIVPADYDGDGKADLAVYRDGVWYITNSSDSTFTVIQFGLAGDMPQPGDYDGDGRADITVFRPSDGTWYLNSPQNGISAMHFGLSTDVPVADDYDGDGKTDIAVFREGVWYLQRSRDGIETIQFGAAGDQPVPADYDGDGTADMGVFRQGVWHMRRNGGRTTTMNFGLETDLAVPADYDGDGKADVAVYRDGVWYTQNSAAGFSARQFGLAGDRPVPFREGK